MQDLLDRIVAETGVAPDTAENAVRIILGFLHREGPSDTVARIADELGARHLLGDVRGGGGLFGAIGGMLGGGAMAAFGALTALGLDMDKIQAVTAVVVDHARARVGDDPVREVTESIPGLARFL